VLEAATLIKQHLRQTGQEQYYILDDEFSSYTKLLKFVWTTFSASSDIVLAFGKPMDIFGNFVDENGVSLDSQGREVDIRSYFMSRGKVQEDAQRDAEYTRLLGDKIAERYLVENHVFSSHLVAFVAFAMLRKRNKGLDLFEILRLPEEDRNFSLSEYRENLERVLNRLRDMADRDQVHLAHHLSNDTMTIIEHGIKNLGIFHVKRALSFLDEATLVSKDLNLLYYYHNRMVGYELEAYIQ
jgi:glycerol-3-phosphate O-acyltransferase